MIVADLLAIVDVCIKASKAWAQHLESRGKGPSKKKDDLVVNTTDQGDHKDHSYHDKQSSDQKERRPFRRPDDVEKWREIHRTTSVPRSSMG
jgi:hypothetical protein